MVRAEGRERQKEGQQEGGRGHSGIKGLNSEPEEGGSPWAEAARESRMGDREPRGPSDSGSIPPSPAPARNLRARL